MKKAARKLLVRRWGSFCRRDQHNIVIDCSAPVSSPSGRQEMNISSQSQISPDITTTPSSSDKNLCAICLDPLNYTWGVNPVFTAQCSHAFHFTCISSNVRHGNLTCPICRAHWTQLPRNPTPGCPLHSNAHPSTPSHRNALLHPRYTGNADEQRLHLSLHTEILPNCLPGPSSMEQSSNRAYLCVKLLNPPAIDLVLVASPTGPHLRLMKQAMALTVFSLRPVDRLAIVTHTSGSARPFPLRHMTSCGKRTALQIINCIFYMGHHVDPIDGLTKGAKILESRLNRNPESSIIHLTDKPVMVPFPVHTFDVRYGFNASGMLFEHEFEGFIARVVGGGVEDIELRIGGGGMVVSVGEMRGGEERKVPVCLGDTGRIRVGYRYKEGGCSRRGDVVVEVKREESWGCFSHHHPSMDWV